MIRVLKRAWIPLVLVVVLTVAALIVVHLRGIFGSQDLNADAGAGIQIVEFNPKILTYEVFGPAGTTASINYWDAEANTHQVDGVQLPWTHTITTTLSAVTANIMAQGDSNQIGCRVVVDDVVKDEETAEGVNAQTFCLVKSA
ncbi:MAG: MmpS family transport accessory protein [Mycolicibacterium sp.]|uniref:MmpS family transport accessory protein n=1 Tax=Mycolicibacterium sp. TaxID=2320850 RepID=UPI003D13B198